MKDASSSAAKPSSLDKGGDERPELDVAEHIGELGVLKEASSGFSPATDLGGSLKLLLGFVSTEPLLDEFGGRWKEAAETRDQ